MKTTIIVGFFVLAIVLSFALFNRYPDTPVAPSAPAPAAVVAKITPAKVKAKKGTRSHSKSDPACEAGPYYGDGQGEGFFDDYGQSMVNLNKAIHDCKAAEQRQ
jgi:hypothetical protein